jgi:hypothetical protein
MTKPLLLSSLLGGLALCVAATPAFAQTEPPPPPATTPPPNSAPVTSVGSGAIGVGAEVWLSGLAGGEFVYDQPMFHIEAILGFNDTSAANNGGSTTDFTVGVAGWYHLARGTNADFSVGGGVGLEYHSPNAGPSTTSVAIEPGAEARVFLTPNFALNARVGFAIDVGNNNSNTVFSLGGQETAALGFTYFFR